MLNQRESDVFVLTCKKNIMVVGGGGLGGGGGGGGSQAREFCSRCLLLL